MSAKWSCCSLNAKDPSMDGVEQLILAGSNICELSGRVDFYGWNNQEKTGGLGKEGIRDEKLVPDVSQAAMS